MSDIFLTVLNMSLTGAFVIAAICIARLPLKKAPKIISYCLWAVAGFRLVFPFSIDSVFSLIPFNAETIPANIATQAVPQINSGIPAVNSAVSSVLPAATPYASVNPLQIWITIGAYLWIIIAVAMVIYGIVSFLVLKRKMKKAVYIENNIYESENIQSPFVLGILKPLIYLPAGLVGQERSYIILHEQTHIRRRDHIIKFAAYFILCLHWFNPLAWVAFLLMGVDMEMSCDERVLKELGGDIKKDYSLSLLLLATQRRFVGGSPLAFGESGITQRIKNVLNFKKPSRVVLVSAIALVAVLSIGFAVNKAIDKDLSMQGTNLSDLQTDEIIRHIVDVTNAENDSLGVLLDNFSLDVTGDFDWMGSPAISVLISKSGIGGDGYYGCQLRIFSEEGRYWVTEPQREDEPDQRYLLAHYLNALKYLPQDHIKSLVRDNPDEYSIVFRGNGIMDDGQPCVFYNMNGLTDINNGWYVSFDIQPLYNNEDGTGYSGLGTDVIHVFYGDTTSGHGAANSTQTYYTDEKLSELSELRTPYVGNNSAVGKIIYALPQTYDGFIQQYFSIGDDYGTGKAPYTLTLYYEPIDIESYDITNVSVSLQDAAVLFALIDNLEEVNFTFRDTPSDGALDTSAYGSRSSCTKENVIRYYDRIGLSWDDVTNDLALIFATPITSFVPREWVNYDNNEDFWTTTADLMLNEFPGVLFSWSSDSVTALENGTETQLIYGMPVWNVYLADLNSDDLPEFCATISYGSGIVDTRVIVCDFANSRTYELSDRMAYDYALSMENGILSITQTEYMGGAIGSVGTMAIIDNELVLYGIDRTLPE